MEGDTVLWDEDFMSSGFRVEERNTSEAKVSEQILKM